MPLNCRRYQEMNRKPGFAAALDSGTATAPKPRTTRTHLGLWRAKGPSERARGLETLQKETGERAGWAGIEFLLISPTSPEPPT